ncbi:hypothetical protein [Paenibacillus guangzhouensis]|nr:hypothetical protein [Paenibacillus guangzhouensis]
MKKEYPMEWQMRFVQYLQGAGRERLQAIEKVMHEIDYEQIHFY